jgi:hypothetical protein
LANKTSSDIERQRLSRHAQELEEEALRHEQEAANL